MAAVCDYDVIVAGGGPVGLCAALLLAESGISVRVCEAEAALSEDLRASTFHPPTLDMLDTIGLSGRLVAQGLVCPSWQIRLHPSGERAVFDLSVLASDTKHPFRLQCEQWKLSRLLLDRLMESDNADVSFGTRVSEFTQHEDAVCVTIAHETETESATSRYLIGADGARSRVRDVLSLGFDGETYPETTILATTTFPFEEHLEGLSNVTYCWKEGGNFSLLKVPGRWRVSIYPREDIPIEDQLSEASVEANLQDIVARPERYEVIERRAYRVHQRIVPRYVLGRVMLAGDAAHINSPAGGMGLNGGIHDAFELARTLTGIIKKDESEATLARYDARRRPVASEHIIAQADTNRARMRERSLDKRREILSGLQEITRDRTLLREHLLKSSMIAGLQQAAAVN